MRASEKDHAEPARGQACQAKIALIIVTDDGRHAAALLASIDAVRDPEIVTQIANRETMVHEFHAAVDDSRGMRPAIVFLDCRFLKLQAEIFAACVRKLQRSMVIECVATRPPAEFHRRRNLSLLGVSFFDGSLPTAGLEALILRTHNFLRGSGENAR